MINSWKESQVDTLDKEVATFTADLVLIRLMVIMSFINSMTISRERMAKYLPQLLVTE